MQGLTSYHIKLIAAATMLIDHIGAVFYPDTDWFRAVGRISFPLFVWLLVQGETHTRNVWRYAVRLGLLGLLSQPIYQLTFGVTDFNILFQLLVGLVCLHLARRQTWLQLPLWLAGAAVTELLNINYGSYGIALVLLTCYFRPTIIWWLAWVGFHLIWVWHAGAFQIPAVIAPIFFMLANGERGAKARWFYGFYPGHLALLSLIRWITQ